MAKQKRKPAKRAAGRKKIISFDTAVLILTFMFSYFPLHGWIYAFLITGHRLSYHNANS